MKSFKARNLFCLALLSSFCLPFLSCGKTISNEQPKFAPKGMVAYAASYSTDPTKEPKYSTQNNKTFQYLNLGRTLDLYRGDSVKVGIIDSGINYDHEDFMVSGSTKVKGDSKYYEYQTSSWVYYKASQHGYSYIDDKLGHGTNVAATVAAAINSVGGTGLAPNVELYVYKVTNSSNGYEFGAIQNALMDAQTLGIKVINMSFQSYEHAVSYGGSSMPASTGCSTILSYYLNQAYNAGITLVGAAGNYNTDEPSYPGSNNHVINVGSLNQTGTDKAGFSNYGSTIDLVAPGYVHVADKGTNSSYKDTSGTSFSAPLVTAAIALYKQQNPSATPTQIETALYASCDPIQSGSTYSNWAGHGALNVAKFLNIPTGDGPTEIVINNPEVVGEELELEVGDTFDLDWTVNGVGTFDDSVSIYLLDDNGTLSVDDNGHITALKEGSDYVVIESNADDSVYASIYVTVTSSTPVVPTVTSVTVSPSALSLYINGTKTSTLSATVNGDNNPSQAVTWSSSNTSVATVNASGVVTAISTGSATITATSVQDNTKSGTCSVNVYRQVIETSESLLSTITYPSSASPSISPTNSVSVSSSGSTTFEDKSLRLGSSSKTGSITVTATSSVISKIVVSAKSYGSDTSVQITIGGSSYTITSSYSDYVKEYSSLTNTVTIATVASKKRAHVQSITVYSKSVQDISDSQDCLGLESFIKTYMHMDYTDNLGYCKDSTHHYYSTAKEAFNALNDHQRSLFTSNSAYSAEWDRLSTWAKVNGDELTNTNTLAKGSFAYDILEENTDSNITLIILISVGLLSITTLLLIIKKKKNR